MTTPMCPKCEATHFVERAIQTGRTNRLAVCCGECGSILGVMPMPELALMASPDAKSPGIRKPISRRERREPVD